MCGFKTHRKENIEVRINVKEEALLKAIKLFEVQGLSDLYEEFNIAFEKSQEKAANSKVNTVAAVKARTQIAKSKVENAVNLLRLEGRNITAYMVSKVSGVTVRTAKSYLEKNGY